MTPFPGVSRRHMVLFRMTRTGLRWIAPMAIAGSLGAQDLISLAAKLLDGMGAYAALSPSTFAFRHDSPPVVPVQELPQREEPSHPWKTGIVATVFWVGEQPGPRNPVSNCASSWDHRWIFSFGGYDDPAPARRTAEFRPVSFVPRQNPFYVALPYNDCLDSHTTKTEASKVIPWFKETFQKHGQSVCRDRWIAIRYRDRLCYAQWSDCGPFVTNDARYVFGEAIKKTISYIRPEAVRESLVGQIICRITA